MAVRELNPDMKKTGALALALFALFLLLRDIRGPGITWDEAVYIPAAANYISWFEEISHGIRTGNTAEALSADTIRRYWLINWEHPPLAKYTSAFSMRLLTGFIEPVAAARAGSAFLSALTVLLVFLIADKFYGGYAGLFSAVFLIIMPRFFGHGRLASLDVSLTFAWVLTAYLFSRIEEGRLFVFLSGLALGLSLLAKLNAALIPPVLIAWALVYRKHKALNKIPPALLIAAATVFILWPWLWHSPAAKIEAYFRFHFMRGYIIPVFYLGRIYKDSPAPFHYPLVLTLFTLPPAALAFCAYKFRDIVEQRLKDPRDGFILLNAAAPILVLTLPVIAKYDGIRLFLPAFPFIAVLAGAGLDGAVKALGARAGKKTALAAAALLLLAGSVPLFRLNPFQLSYYNAFSGGIRGARALGMETTYWGDTLGDDILSYINKNAGESAGVVFYPVGENVIRLKKLTGGLREDIEELPAARLSEADFLVLIRRRGMFTAAVRSVAEEKEPEFSNGWGDVPFTEVYRLDSL